MTTTRQEIIFFVPSKIVEERQRQARKWDSELLSDMYSDAPLPNNTLLYSEENDTEDIRIEVTQYETEPSCHQQQHRFTSTIENLYPSEKDKSDYDTDDDSISPFEVFEENKQRNKFFDSEHNNSRRKRIYEHSFRMYDDSQSSLRQVVTKKSSDEDSWRDLSTSNWNSSPQCSLENSYDDLDSMSTRNYLHLARMWKSGPLFLERKKIPTHKESPDDTIRREYSNGNVFEGVRLEGKKNWKGKMTYPDGSVFIGTWRNGLREGVGRCIFADGSFYKGEFKSGNYHGQGIIMWKDGGYYVGEWQNNEMHGNGVEIRADGSERHVGKWVKGSPVRQYY